MLFFGVWSAVTFGGLVPRSFLDEPFGALDHQTRELMQELLLGIREQERQTVLFVTHDIDQAVFMGTRVVVMSARPGRSWACSRHKAAD